MASLWTKPTGLYCISYKKNGKTVNRSLRTKNRREALQLKKEIEALLEENCASVLQIVEKPKTKPKNPTFEEFTKELFEWLKVNLSSSSLEEYQNWLTQFAENTKINRLGDVTPEMIEGFKASLLRQGKRKPKGVGLSPESINDALKTLQSAWSWSIKMNLYSGTNPFQGVRRFKIPKNPHKDYLDKPQIENLLNTAANYHSVKYVKTKEAQNVHCAIALMGLAGLRRKEVCFSKWEWIDWEKRLIVVKNDEAFTTKSKNYRIISLSQQLYDILYLYKEESGYILENQRKTEVKSNRYRVEFKNGFNAVCKLAGIETSPHQLRHSFASRHAIAGTSLHVLAGWLGHSTTWVTERYAHFQSTYNEAANNI